MFFFFYYGGCIWKRNLVAKKTNELNNYSWYFIVKSMKVMSLKSVTTSVTSIGFCRIGVI